MLGERGGREEYLISVQFIQRIPAITHVQRSTKRVESK
jgi:hypothetical protein